MTILDLMKAMQGQCRQYLEPTGYTSFDRKRIAFEKDREAQDSLFINDMIYLLDGPEQREAEAQYARLEEAVKDVTVHLIAAVSLLGKLHGDLPASKKHALFNTKIGDYNRSIERARISLATNLPNEEDKEVGNG